MGALLTVGFFIIGSAIGAFFLAIGASVAGIERRTFGKAFMATVGAMIAGAVVGGVLGVFGMHNGFIPAAIGLLTNLAVIRSVYDTSWGKAFVAWLVEVIAVVVLVGVPLVALLGTAILFS
jgi:hypothetical protein